MPRLCYICNSVVTIFERPMLCNSEIPHWLHFQCLPMKPKCWNFDWKCPLHSHRSQGSPFQFHVDSISSGYVTAYGPGLSHGVSGEPANFTISTKGAGIGDLTMAMEGPSKADIGCYDNKDGTVAVSYLPTAPGEYKISVKFCDKHIKDSPFSAKVTESPFKFHVDSISSGYVTAYGPGLSQGVSGEPANFTISTKGAGIGSLTLAMEGPSKADIGCHDNKDGTVAVSYLPTAPGEYKISVKFSDQHIKGSPFSAKVTGSPFQFHVDSISSGYVTAYGPGLSHGVSGEPANFTISTKGAGIGGLTMAMEGPSKADIGCHDNKDGTVAVSYLPTAPGEYKISVKFWDEHIIGSPFSAKITEVPHNEVEEVDVVDTGKETCPDLWQVLTSSDNATTVVDAANAIAPKVANGLWQVLTSSDNATTVVDAAQAIAPKVANGLWQVFTSSDNATTVVDAAQAIAPKVANGLWQVLTSSDNVTYLVGPSGQCNSSSFSTQDVAFTAPTLRNYKKEFTCEKCTKKFKTKVTLLKHHKSNLGKRSLYFCELCKVTFNYKCVVEDHYNFVHNKKVHPCDNCGHPFYSKSSVNAHKVKYAVGFSCASPFELCQ